VPIYRVRWSGELPELPAAGSARWDGIHTVLRGATLVIGIPREIVLRPMPRNVVVEQAGEDLLTDQRSWTVH
jgi:hypothetical protein